MRRNNVDHFVRTQTIRSFRSFVASLSIAGAFLGFFLRGGVLGAFIGAGAGAASAVAVTVVLCGAGFCAALLHWKDGRSESSIGYNCYQNSLMTFQRPPLRVLRADPIASAAEQNRPINRSRSR